MNIGRHEDYAQAVEEFRRNRARLLPMDAPPATGAGLQSNHRHSAELRGDRA